MLRRDCVGVWLGGGGGGGVFGWGFVWGDCVGGVWVGGGVAWVGLGGGGVGVVWGFICVAPSCVCDSHLGH